MAISIWSDLSLRPAERSGLPPIQRGNNGQTRKRRKVWLKYLDDYGFFLWKNDDDDAESVPADVAEYYTGDAAVHHARTAFVVLRNAVMKKIRRGDDDADASKYVEATVRVQSRR